MARLNGASTGGGGGGTIGGGGTDNYIPVFAGSTDIEDSNLLLTAASTISNDNLHTLTAVTDSFIYGASNVVNTVTHSIIIGQTNTVTGTHHAVFGTINQVAGLYNVVGGDNNIITLGDSCAIFGEFNTNTSGNFNFMAGNDNTNVGTRNIIVARSTTVTGNENAVFGRTHVAVTGARNLVAGNNHNIEGSFNVFGGENHTATGASADYNAIFGVSNAIGNGDYNLIGGRTHSLDGSQRNIIGGESHTASSLEYSFLSGLGHVMASTMQYIGVVGNQSNIDASFSFTHGQYARNYIYGSHTHTAGKFFENGDSQTSVATLYKATTDDTVTELALDGATTYLSTKNNRAYSYKVTIVAKQLTSTNYAVYKLEFGAVREADASTFAINGLIKTTIHETVAGWDVNVTANTTNGRPNISVTGVAATDIRWTARVEIVEVGTVFV